MKPGQLLTSSLRLVSPLARGGMGSIWVAEHLGLRTQMAVKFMSPALVENASAVARFSQEASAAARIRSPHVVQVFDHGVTAEGAPYIVMELLEGEDLGMRLSRLGPCDPPEVVHIIRQTAKALTRAHQFGIVHRDIKPSNLFLVLDDDGALFVKVLDFEIAKQQGEFASVTSSGSLLGSPLYISPEQLFSAKHVDFRTDLWSLAAVAYHSLVGHPPFEGETLAQVSVQIDRGTFLLPSALRHDLPPAVDAWFLRALNHDPSRRFASAVEMAEELDRAFSQRSSPDLARLPVNERTTPLPVVRTAPGGHPHGAGTALPPTLHGTAAPARPAAHRGYAPVIAAVATIVLLGSLLVLLISRVTSEPQVQAIEGPTTLPPPAAAPESSAPSAWAPADTAPAPFPSGAPDAADAGADVSAHRPGAPPARRRNSASPPAPTQPKPFMTTASEHSCHAKASPQDDFSHAAPHRRAARASRAGAAHSRGSGDRPCPDGGRKSQDRRE